MKNFIQPGETVTVLAPDDVVSGAGVLVGALFGVASTSVLSGNDVEIARRGVFEMAKVSAQAWTQGAKIYWDNAAKKCTSAASGNTLVGVAADVAANPSVTGKVLLDGAVR